MAQNVDDILNADNETYMSPKVAIQRMASVVKKHGKDDALAADYLQPVRECWIAGLFLFGYSQISKNLFWLKPNPKPKEAPDIFSVSFRDPITNSGEIGVVREKLDIEIVEYEEHATVSLSQHIKDKLNVKDYGQETILLCYGRLPRYEFKPSDLANELKSINNKIREIWIIFQPDGEATTVFKMVRVYLRGNDNYYLDYSGNFTVLYQADFIEESRGPQKKLAFDKLGLVYFPLPKNSKLVKKIEQT